MINPRAECLLPIGIKPFGIFAPSTPSIRKKLHNVCEFAAKLPGDLQSSCRLCETPNRRFATLPIGIIHAAYAQLLIVHWDNDVLKRVSCNRGDASVRLFAISNNILRKFENNHLIYQKIKSKNSLNGSQNPYASTMTYLLFTPTKSILKTRNSFSKNF